MWENALKSQDPWKPEPVSARKRNKEAMSKTHTETLKCPQCGESIEFTLWESLNTKLDPEQAALFRSGGQFLVECPKCGARHQVVHPILYHDMEHGMILQLLPGKTRDELLAEAGRLKESTKELLSAYEDLPMPALRMTADPYTVIEKAKLLVNGRDDRIVEIMKLLCLPSLIEQFKKQVVLYYDDSEGEDVFAIIDPETGLVGTLPFMDEVYRMLEKEVDHLGDGPEGDAVVDVQWALARMKTLQEIKKESAS